jgi:hypothetical protein
MPHVLNVANFMVDMMQTRPCCHHAEAWYRLPEDTSFGVRAVQSATVPGPKPGNFRDSGKSNEKTSLPALTYLSTFANEINCTGIVQFRAIYLCLYLHLTPWRGAWC